MWRAFIKLKSDSDWTHLATTHGFMDAKRELRFNLEEHGFYSRLSLECDSFTEYQIVDAHDVLKGYAKIEESNE